MKHQHTPGLRHRTIDNIRGESGADVEELSLADYLFFCAAAVAQQQFFFLCEEKTTYLHFILPL